MLAVGATRSWSWHAESSHSGQASNRRSMSTLSTRYPAKLYQSTSRASEQGDIRLLSAFSWCRPQFPADLHPPPRRPCSICSTRRSRRRKGSRGAGPSLINHSKRFVPSPVSYGDGDAGHKAPRRSHAGPARKCSRDPRDHGGGCGDADRCPDMLQRLGHTATTCATTPRWTQRCGHGCLTALAHADSSAHKLGHSSTPSSLAGFAADSARLDERILSPTLKV